MITDIEEKSKIGPDLRTDKLKPYWNEYFVFRDEAPELHKITEDELTIELDNARSQAKPFIDSQQVIARILTKLGSKASFHRQFTEKFPSFRQNQVLGMQLYALVASDAEIWIYTPIQHQGHMFPHSSYFLLRY